MTKVLLSFQQPLHLQRVITKIDSISSYTWIYLLSSQHGLCFYFSDTLFSGGNYVF